jgi:hypothetical protein
MKYQHHFYGLIQGVSQTFGFSNFHTLVVKVILKFSHDYCKLLVPAILLCLMFFPIPLTCSMLLFYVTLIAQGLRVALPMEPEEFLLF